MHRALCRSVALLALIGLGSAWHFLASDRGRQDPADAAIDRGEHGQSAGIWSSRRLHERTPEEHEDEKRMKIIFSHRSHLTTIGCPVSDASLHDVVCIKQTHGLVTAVWMLLYTFGIVYMFVAIAIVCDEFFVPALETFAEQLDISMDVAGATFMAAGGSAPELCLSFYGTFQESTVGFRAIVGSAVFNVLFVIAVCAVASTEVLTLTWWPLARDSCCYVFALTTLVITFSGSSPGTIEWWEAAILFLEYIGYCTLMYYNERIYCWLSRRSSQVTPEGEAISDKTLKKGHTSLQFPSTFRQGIVQLLLHNTNTMETAGIAAVTQIAGDLEQTFKQVDKDASGFIEENELASLLELLGVQAESKRVKAAFCAINRSGDGRISFQEFKKWYLVSEARVEVETRRIFDQFDHDDNGTIEVNEIAALLKSLGHHPKESEINQIVKEMLQGSTETVTVKEVGSVSESEDTIVCDGVVPSGKSHSSTGSELRYDDAHISFEQFDAWYGKSMYMRDMHLKHQRESEAAEDAGFNVDLPEDAGWSGTIWYIYTYPICIALYATMPDVRRPKHQGSLRTAAVEFSLSLVWIAFFACCLVDWVTITTYTIGIPVSVAAVTVLAAGTSIPDLLSSYIVARRGEGDMAVSSSIGSNIFDITVGLPIPWLAYNITKRKPFEVGSTRGDSVVVLIVMLILVISTIMVMDWRMTKHMGYVMFFLYVVFIVQDILHDIPVGNPAIPYIL